MPAVLKAPFIYYGGKSKVARVVWAALGDVRHYIEPFLGSGAVFLNRPHPHRVATLNELEPHVVNFWRCVQADSDGLVKQAMMPVFESNLHAVHAWLVNHKAELRERIEGDPAYYDVQAAAWWAWGQCCWIGGGWCDGKGPWVVRDGRMKKESEDGRGVKRRLPHISKRGQGFLVSDDPASWFKMLAEQFAGARICCGDWSRVCGPTTISAQNPTGIFFDPPYGLHLRTKLLYAQEDDCSQQVQAWCLEHGQDDGLRIVLAGYDGEHNPLEDQGWRVYAWKANGGYGRTARGRENATKERLWISPNCDNNFLDNSARLL